MQMRAEGKSAKDREPVRRQLLTNSAAGVLQLSVSTILTFIAVPILVRKLGTEGYGVFSIITIVGSLNVFTNLGLNSSLIKFLAEQGKTKESNYDILVTMIISTIVIVPATVLLALFGNFVLTGILNVPQHELLAAHSLYLCALWANLLIFLGQTLTAILDSQQKIYLTNILQMVYNFLYWGLLIVLSILGFSLGDLGIAIIVAAVVWFVVAAWMVIKVWGRFDYAGIGGNFHRIAHKQMSYGKNIYLSGVTNFFYEPITRILISNLIGIREVGYFDIALKVKGQLVGLASKVLYPLFPLFSKLRDPEKVKMIVTDLQQKMFFLIVPCVAVIVFTARPFVRLWIGADLTAISTAIVVITSANLLFSITVIPNYHFMTAKNHTEVLFYSQLGNVLANFILLLATFKFLGFNAALLGNAIGIFCGFLVLNYYQKKFLQTMLFSSVKSFLKLAAMMALCFTVSFVIALEVHSNVERLVMMPLIVGPLALMFFRALNVFTEVDLINYFGEHRHAHVILKKLLVR